MDARFTFKHISKTTTGTDAPFPNTSQLTRSGSAIPYDYRLEISPTHWEGSSASTKKSGWDDKVTLREGSTDKVTLYFFPPFTYKTKTIAIGIYTLHTGDPSQDPTDDQGVWMATQDLGT